MQQCYELLFSMIEEDGDKRPEANELLSHPIFDVLPPTVTDEN